ncbi:carboxypeptidase-like regulatory domain-containing protein [Hymenobacter koreensis]|uniref:CarboxypepD_reg-like domain-containing protein n=1 Tax=Hymenobacter koreensis TaxID=1084523 RepID=A0ABP8JIW8_9BACT
MALSASPFHPTTGELLPVYRDAYLRGDLSKAHSAAVDAYFKKYGTSGTDAWQRFHQMQQEGESVQAVGWVQRQFDLLKVQPQRMRRRAATLVTAAALIAGATMAGNHVTSPADNIALDLSAAESSAAMRTVTVRGRILDENGKPLVGATVLEKGSLRGVSTDANGNYSLRVLAGRPTTLAYGYGGYADDELQVRGNATNNVTLVPRDNEAPVVKKHRRWLLF